MVSRALHGHADVLSLSELFASLYPFDFGPSDRVSRDRFVEILTCPRAEASLLFRHRAEPAEHLYPVDGDGRYGRARGVPPVAVTALPHLSDDADHLLDRIVARVPGRTWGVAEAFRWLFDVLAADFGKSAWVERSGSSLLYVDRLRRRFPQARFVHLYRSGPATAVSMAAHPVFRLTYLKQLAALRAVSREGGRSLDLERVWEDADGLEEALSAALGQPITHDLLVNQPVRVEWFGLLWSFIVCRGLRHLGRLEPSMLLHVPYEGLVDDPSTWLARIARFLGVVVDPAWLTQHAASIVPRRGSMHLRSPERRRLERACAGGVESLEAALATASEASGR